MDNDNKEIDDDDANSIASQEESEQADTSKNEESLNSHSSSDEEDDDEDVDEDDEPPRFKYTRFNGLPHSFYNKDAISASLFHPSIIVFATHSGFVHLMRPNLTPIRTFRAHRASVLAIHTDGEYVATGSMDGTVTVGSIDNQSDIFAVDFKRPIHSVVLDGQYSVTKSFITGGASGKVILSTKNWLGQRVDTVIEENHGLVLNLQIFGDLVIWMNDTGLNFYQLTSRTKLYQISLPKDFPRPDLYWPKLEILDNFLLVGWANNVWCIKLIELVSNNDTRSILSTRSASSLERKIHIDKHIQLKDTLIAGLSSFHDDFLVLNYVLPLDKKPQPPELKIISGITLEDLSVDEVEMKNFPSLGLNDYQLRRYNSSKWFLVGANDVIIVEEFNQNDKLEWLLDRENYLEAWSISQHLIPENLRYETIALKQLERYVNDENWVKAKEFLIEVVENIHNEELLRSIWGHWLIRFQDESKYELIVDKVPLNIKLDSRIYDTFIDYYLSLNNEKVVDLIRRWDHSYFNITNVNHQIGELLNNYDQGDKDGLSEDLIHSLRNLHIDICIELNDNSHAAIHYMRNKDPSTLKFLSENNLLRDFLKDIPDIVTIDIPSADLKQCSIDLLQDKLQDRLQILIDNRHEIVPDEIIELMKQRGLDVVNFFYLRQLFKTSGFITTNFENEMASLYSEFDNSQLLSFFRKYRNYDIETAIEICQSKNLVRELVFLYSRIGQNKKALDLIINDLDDPQYAIEFTLSLKDSELFEHLVNYSADKPLFIKLLIIEAGSNNVDPKKIVTRVPEEVEVENLQTTLINISANNNNEVMINEKVLKIIQDETMAYIYESRNAKLKGALFDPVLRPEILEGETIVKFPIDKKLYKESDIVTEPWTHVLRNISDKIKHFIYIKNRKSV